MCNEWFSCDCGCNVRITNTITDQSHVLCKICMKHCCLLSFRCKLLCDIFEIIYVKNRKLIPYHTAMDFCYTVQILPDLTSVIHVCDFLIRMAKCSTDTLSPPYITIFRVQVALPCCKQNHVVGYFPLDDFPYIIAYVFCAKITRQLTLA